MPAPRLFKAGTGQTAPHLHVVGKVCPLCEQSIPDDRLDEITGRMEAWEQRKAAEVTTRLQEQFARDKAEALIKVQAEAAAALEREREEAASKIAEARDEARQLAETQAQEKLAAVQREREIEKEGLEQRLGMAEAAQATVAESLKTVTAELQQVRQDSEAALKQVREEAAANEAAVRKDAEEAATSKLQERIEAAERAKVEAEAKATTAEQQASTLKAEHEETLARRLAEQREALEQSRNEAVNAQKSAAFEEKMKLSTKVEELQRALDKKTAEELGEGAEIDLFETLKAEFEGDRIERVNKGQPGADILHTVIHNGKECGRIIYNSKNHGAWRNEFVTKLASDKMAAKAEHAILSTRKFPAGARQLHVQDGVLLASPSRVAALVQIVRQHLVQTHTLRMSNEERSQKTAMLYEFITSERCADLFSRIDVHAEDLLDIQVQEKKAHDRVWKRQGELIRSVQRVNAEIGREIDAIVGTGDAEESA